MEKFKLEYEETKEGYSLNIEGTTKKVTKEENALQVLEHQIKIVSKIFFHLCEQKLKLADKIKNDASKQEGVIDGK